MKIADFSVIDHGTDGEQYFTGCGTAFTSFEHVETGCGDNFAEAIEDALSSIAMSHDVDNIEEFKARIKAEGFSGDTDGWQASVSAYAEAPDNDEWHYYVSIRFNFEGEI